MRMSLERGKKGSTEKRGDLTTDEVASLSINRKDYK
jgi:hypothetical protein